MKIVNETKLDFDDILLVPSRSPTASRKEVDLDREFSFFHSSRKWSGVPIMAANMDTTGSFEMSKKLSEFGLITCLHKYYSADDIVLHLQKSILPYAWVSIGMNDHDDIKLKRIQDALGFTPNICIDIANGYTDKFVEWCFSIREKTGDDPIIMAGNVCTPEIVQELILHGGVDIVKVGIGPGSACTTRLKTGVGYPQLSAIIECSHAAHGLKSGERRMGLMCADGGCRTPADVCKAFAANADFVMLGGMFAGTEECEGDWQYETIETREKDGYGYYHGGKKKKSLSFYGMSSQKSQEKHSGKMSAYRSSEGREITIPYKGPVGKIVLDILGGIRSACAYTGATCLKDLPKCAKAVMVRRTHFDHSI